MADITWSAYALAMFTPEQRAAAVAGTSSTLPPGDEGPVVLPRAAPGPVIRTSAGVRVEGLDPNIPAELQEIQRRGYRFIDGAWRHGALGTIVDPEADANAPLGGRVGLSSVSSATVIPGGSVLGHTVPLAPAVLLPSFVGGRTGRVTIGEGLRPASGGGERVRFGRFAQVRGLAL